MTAAAVDLRPHLVEEPILAKPPDEFLAGRAAEVLPVLCARLAEEVGA